MISREFVYEFSNFDDIPARENDKKSRAMGFSTRAMGVSYKFGVIQHYKVGFGCRQNLRSSIKHPLRVRPCGVYGLGGWFLKYCHMTIAAVQATLNECLVPYCGISRQ